jgi:hypothetical protein
MHAKENAARMTDPKVLIAFESDADDRCWGGSGDQRSTWNACDERAEYYDRLHAYPRIGTGE